MGRTRGRRAGGGCAAVTGAFHCQVSVPPGIVCPEHSGAVPHLSVLAAPGRAHSHPGLGSHGGRGCGGEGRGAAPAAGMSIPTGDSTLGGFIPPWRP